ncbi:MAG: sigma 54-interacting transcriptional regulator [Myxococcota bacterium]
MAALCSPLELKADASSVWEAFVRGARLKGALGRVWERSRQLGVDPLGAYHSSMVDAERRLSERRGQAERLRIETEHALQRDFNSQRLNRQAFIALLADRDGVVLERFGGGAFREEADRLKLVEGAHWSESARGTNAIGTALAERGAVEVVGAAHFAQPNHSLACYADVIHGPRSDVLGTLDVTSFERHANPQVGALVRAICIEIEAALFVDAWGHSACRVLESSIGRCQQPALVITRNDRVHCTNQAFAATMRSLARPGSHFPLSQLGTDWSRLTETGDRRSPTPSDEAGSRFAQYNVSTELLHQRDGEVIGAALFFEPSRSATGAKHVRPREKSSPAKRSGFGSLVGADPEFLATLETASRVAPTVLPVLLLAETGTGKELLARAIHENSDRADQELVAINCGAFSSDLMASELFGYAPGAFTGADSRGRDGQLAAADGSTLFLDEVAEMSPALQVMLLRFLDEGVYRRVGETEPRRADVRLICATCRDLPALVKAGDFRADLYYRIKGATLHLPPLRERCDLPHLAESILTSLAAEESLSVTPALSRDAGEVLSRHTWPGNMRELRHALHWALIRAGDSGLIDVHHLELATESSESSNRALSRPPPACRASDRIVALGLADQRAQTIRQTLERTGGNVSEAARRLNVARSTIYRTAKRYRLT